MDRIFFGAAFVLLDITLDMGDRTIGLLPDFLGYWWLARGFYEMDEEWEGFRKGRIPALVLAVYSAVLYGLDLAKLNPRQEFWLWILQIGAAAAAVAMSWFVGRGVGRMEDAYSWDLEGEKLRGLWRYLAVLQVLGGILSWVPMVGMGCRVAVFVMAVCWLAALNDARKRYNAI